MNINAILRYDVYGPTLNDLGLRFSFVKKTPPRLQQSKDPFDDVLEERPSHSDTVDISQAAQQQLRTHKSIASTTETAHIASSPNKLSRSLHASADTLNSYPKQESIPPQYVNVLA